MTVRDNARMKSQRVLPLLALLSLAACAGKGAGSTVESTVATLPSSTVPTTTTTVTHEAVEVAPAVAAVGLTVNRELATGDGRVRSYHLYVPSDLPTGPVPLLIALHGGTGSGTQFRRSSGFDELAEANGFLVVFPDGVGLGADGDLFRTWNGGYCCGSAMKQDVDDVGFIDALIDDIVGEYDVDASRIFAAGHSNGGIMAYRLACELSDRIVAIGLQAGSLGINECEPSQPVSVFHLHGTDDENHPIEGGVGANSISDTYFRSATYSVETSAEVMGCQEAPTDSVDATNPDLAITSWTNCSNGAEVRLVAVADAPHSWMELASTAILEFLLNHPRG